MCCPTLSKGRVCSTRYDAPLEQEEEDEDEDQEEEEEGDDNEGDEEGPASGRNCYATPAFSGFPSKGFISKRGNLTPTFSGPRNGQRGYVTPAFSGVPAKGTKFSGAFGATLCMARSH